MGKDRLNDALSPVGAEGATGAKSTKSTKGKTPSRKYTVTVYLTPELKSRLQRLETDWNRSRSQVVRFLLGYALEQVDKGKLKPKRETVTRVKLD